MTRAQLIAMLNALYASAAAVENEARTQQKLDASYRSTKVVTEPLGLRHWMMLTLGTLFFSWAYSPLLPCTIFCLFVFFRLGLSARNSMLSMSGSKHHAEVVAHNQLITDRINQSKTAAANYSQTYYRYGGEDFYPSQFFSTNALGQVIGYIRNHQADSVGAAINLLCQAEAQRLRDARTQQHHQAVLAEQRRSRASADVNAMLMRWTIEDRLR